MTATMPSATRDAMFPEFAQAVIEQDFSLLDAFPRAAEAAQFLGVEESRLSKGIGSIAPWFDRELHRRGRELRLPPDLVLDAARRFKTRSTSEVAALLVDYAVDHAPAHAETIDDVIERYFKPLEQGSMGGPSIAEFLEAVHGQVTDDVHERLVEIAAGLDD